MIKNLKRKNSKGYEKIQGKVQQYKQYEQNLNNDMEESDFQIPDEKKGGNGVKQIFINKYENKLNEKDIIGDNIKEDLTKKNYGDWFDSNNQNSLKVEKATNIFPNRNIKTNKYNTIQENQTTKNQKQLTQSEIDKKSVLNQTILLDQVKDYEVMKELISSGRTLDELIKLTKEPPKNHQHKDVTWMSVSVDPITGKNMIGSLYYGEHFRMRLNHKEGPQTTDLSNYKEIIRKVIDDEGVKEITRVEDDILIKEWEIKKLGEVGGNKELNKVEINKKTNEIKALYEEKYKIINNLPDWNGISKRRIFEIHIKDNGKLYTHLSQGKWFQFGEPTLSKTAYNIVYNTVVNGASNEQLRQNLNLLNEFEKFPIRKEK